METNSQPDTKAEKAEEGEKSVEEGEKSAEERAKSVEELSPDDLDKERLRFEMELEFLQCLANPLYLNCKCADTYLRRRVLPHFLALAQQLYFEDEAFIEYLKYLQYWKSPEYAKFIVYPHALRFLVLLQEEEFRKSLKNTKVCEEIHLQQFYHWQYYYGKPDSKESKEGEEKGS